MRRTGERAGWHRTRICTGVPEQRTGGCTRRLLGVVLVLYGVAGLPLLGSFALVANDAIDRVAVDPASGALADASAILGDTTLAFGGFETSLVSAQLSTDQAATSARDASTTANHLADGMSISILGAQPLASLASDFRKEATDLDQMAKLLDTVTASMKENDQDVAKIRADLGQLKTRVDQVRSSAPVSVAQLRALLALVVVWLALQALVAFAVGLYLL